VAHSWLGDASKSTDNMTFSLTDDGQEGRYDERWAQAALKCAYAWTEARFSVFSEIDGDSVEKKNLKQRPTRCVFY